MSLPFSRLGLDYELMQNDSDNGNVPSDFQNLIVRRLFSLASSDEDVEGLLRGLLYSEINDMISAMDAPTVVDDGLSIAGDSLSNQEDEFELHVTRIDQKNEAVVLDQIEGDPLDDDEDPSETAAHVNPFQNFSGPPILRHPQLNSHFTMESLDSMETPQFGEMMRRMLARSGTLR